MEKYYVHTKTDFKIAPQTESYVYRFNKYGKSNNKKKAKIESILEGP